MQSNTTACEVADTGSRSAYAKGDDECNSAKRQRFEPPSQSGGLPTYPGTSFPCHEDAWMHPCRWPVESSLLPCPSFVIALVLIVGTVACGYCLRGSRGQDCGPRLSDVLSVPRVVADFDWSDWELRESPLESSWIFRCLPPHNYVSCQHTLSKLVGADVLTKGLQLQNASLDGLRKRSHSSYQDSNKGSSPFLSHDFCSKGLEAVLTLSLDTPETSVLASTYSGSLFGLDSPPFSSIISIRTNNCAHGASCSSGDLRL
eukprot:gene24500-10097_t